MSANGYDPSMPETIDSLATLALSLPETAEKGSCVNRAFFAGKKNFLFLGEKDSSYNIRLKLGASIDEARELAAADPEKFNVGMGGWTKVVFPNDEAPPNGLLERWTKESFRLLVPKRVSKQLDQDA